MKSPSTSEPRPPEHAASPRAGLIVVGAGPTGLGVVRRTARIVSVTVVDSDPAALDDPVSLDEVSTVCGDATSMLVLREAGIDSAYALIAASSEDEINIEACRQAVVAGVPEVLCRISDASRSEEVMAIGAHPVTSAMAMAGALTSQLPGVVVTTSEIGLGEGEILQVRVMPGSLVIGHPLSEIATRAFLVAAIYRSGGLIVPHGDTRVEAGDQVLLVGQPDTLRAVADYFRLGAAQFPRQFGRDLLLWDAEDAPEAAKEAEWLSDLGHVDRLLQMVTDPSGGESASAGKKFERVSVDLDGPGLVDALRSTSVGIHVLPAPRRRAIGLGTIGALGQLLDRVTSPILLSRGTAPYRRILVPVTDSPTSWRGLELAVDIARLVDARITALHVTQPRFLGGNLGEERRAAVEHNVEQVARLYNLHFEVRVVEGNSIRTAAEVAEDHQLVVSARQLKQKDSYFNPDVGLRIALSAPCSSVLLTVA